MVGRLLALPGLGWLDRELLRPVTAVTDQQAGTWAIKPEGRFSRFRRRVVMPEQDAQAELLRRNGWDGPVPDVRYPDPMT